MNHTTSYISIRIFTFPFRYLPQSILSGVGSVLGSLAYHFMTRFRKRALSNLSLAKSLSFTEEELHRTCKASFKSLAITCLEYAKFGAMKSSDKLMECVNPEKAEEIIQGGKGVIFFCGHLANWEVLYLEGIQRFPGVAIGRPIKNRLLYNWILSIRKKFGGEVIPPKDAIKGGLRALRAGKFLGIVGDQGMPESNFSSLFFGRRAFTSPVPALLSYKTGCPIITATVKREAGRYLIHYSDPIWPNPDLPKEEEVSRLMCTALGYLEDKIRENPGQWLWQHNRWKQEPPTNVYYRYRWDTILVILPKKGEWSGVQKALREIYPRAFITLLTPFPGECQLDECEILPYENESDLFIRDYRFKLVFDFSGVEGIAKHFLSLSAFDVLDEEKLARAASEHLTPGDPLPLVMKKALCRPDTLWEKCDAS